jgi:rhomboid family GlyGly-CTERM serine protease
MIFEVHNNKLVSSLSWPAFTRLSSAFYLLIAISLLSVFFQANMSLFIFDREAVNQGEFWRLLTSHFTHSSGSHALWDILAFSAVVYWLGRVSVKQVIVAVFVGIAAVDFLLLSAYSSLEYYCGLSGILFSPLMFACYHFWQSNKGVIGVLPFVICIAKVIWEASAKSMLFVDTGWYAYPEAHQAGVLAGLICCTVLHFRKAKIKVSDVSTE